MSNQKQQQQSTASSNSAAADSVATDSVDVQTVKRLLNECGVFDYEPAVVQQLVEFMYRYCTDLLDDARAYAQHAGKKSVDLEDLKLASACHADLDLVSPPPRELLTEVAQAKNAQLLPPIKTYCGVRLPPEKFCLTQPNYKAKLRKAEARAAVVASGAGGSRSGAVGHGLVSTPSARSSARSSAPTTGSGTLKRKFTEAD
ncbi:hypothetical protein BOX15_Mlig025131g1 [Macrostomum lignano]|uniref:Transcription initiation factor TFIID subunit 9 n=1 Tax=Macrostomum lignano TaxID=282301 RepID=A0A267G128_9PLAT|nr:hypothetical protein BOX15_Mlig025131g1 [Macrostomum lignano]